MSPVYMHSTCIAVLQIVHVHVQSTHTYRHNELNAFIYKSHNANTRHCNFIVNLINRKLTFILRILDPSGTGYELTGSHGPTRFTSHSGRGRLGGLEASCDLCGVAEIDDELDEGFDVLLVEVIIEANTQQLYGDKYACTCLPG